MKKGWQVPDFTVVELKKSSADYCVAVFVINEGERIRSQLKKMKPLTDQIDILIADGGSTDGSLDLSYLKDQDVKALLTKIGPGKLSAQMRMAFAYTLEQEYKGIIVIDGNDKDDVSAVPHFINKLIEGYDHVQGSRFIEGGKAVNTPLLRLLGLHLLHAPLISLAAHYRYTDTTNGFRAYSASLLEDKEIAIFRNVFDTYQLHYFLAINAARKGYKITEVPVTRTYPADSTTPTKIKGFRGNLHILKVLFGVVLGRYNKR